MNVNFINDISDVEIEKNGFESLLDLELELLNFKGVFKFLVNGKSFYFWESEDKKLYLGKNGFKKEIFLHV